MIRIVEGDLFHYVKTEHPQVLIHNCNCMNTWGAGIAQRMKSEYPEAYAADDYTVKGDIKKLGNYTAAHCPRTGMNIINIYGQYTWSRYKTVLNEHALRNALGKMKHMVTGMQIAMPMIGAGLAGGNWESIYNIITEELSASYVTIVKLP